MIEIWKDIPNYEGVYQASNTGRIKSFKYRKPKILLNSYGCGGYYSVGLSGRRFHVHQLVAMAFFNHKPCGHSMVVDHINCIRVDNRVENLRVITHRENISRGHNKKYTGVYESKRKNGVKYTCRITIDGNVIYLGTFNTEKEAIAAYFNELNKNS